MNFIKSFKNHIDYKLALILAIFYTIFNIVHYSKSTYFKYITNENVKSFSVISVQDYILDWFIVVGLMLTVAASTKKFIKENFSWRKIGLIHLSMSLAIGVIIRFFSDLHMVLVGKGEYYNLGFSLNRFIYFIDMNFLIYFAMISIIYGYYYMDKLKELESQKHIIQAKLVETRMRMLGAQLQPHFLFNTLNCITSLIEFDGKKAQNTLVDLSQFLREILHNSETNSITLGKELSILDHYLNILKVRFSDDLIIRKNIDDNLYNHQIPALIIQPIIENSIMHGYSYDHNELIISLKIYREGTYIVIVIENNGLALSDNFKPFLFGTGLSNIDERLRNIYNTNYLFQIQNLKSGNGVENVIRIPLNFNFSKL